MKLSQSFLMVWLLGMASVVYGQEAKPQEANQKPPQKQIEESKKILVILPPITPFDSEPKEKALYLEQYQAGYRNVVAELYLRQDLSRFDFKKGVKGSVFNAFNQGWADGTVKALKDHPEKRQVYPTLYIDNHKDKAPPYPDTGLYIDASKANVHIK